MMSRVDVLPYDKEIISAPKASAAIGVLFFIAAMTLGAYVRIPVKGSPVPITLQTFFALLSGAVLGRKLGIFSQAGYLLLGAMGLPVFQGYASGIGHILGPTGGYLAGFVFASAAVAKLTDSESPGIYRIIAAFIAGSIIIYSSGILWLILFYRTGLLRAVSAGILPFIPGDAVKVCLAALIYSKIAGRSRRIFSA
jgi:biotin transport system substrate-specific component